MNGLRFNRAHRSFFISIILPVCILSKLQAQENFILQVANPYTGDWISGTILQGLGWKKDWGGEERDKDYNHSTFCDLVITGLIGLRPATGHIVTVNPLVSNNT